MLYMLKAFHRLIIEIKGLRGAVLGSVHGIGINGDGGKGAVGLYHLLIGLRLAYAKAQHDHDGGRAYDDAQHRQEGTELTPL